MQLTIKRAYELVTRHGVFARDYCDKCGRLLGAVRFTRNVRPASGAVGNAAGMTPE